MKGLRLFSAVVNTVVLAFLLPACKEKPVKPEPGTTPVVNVTEGTAGKSTLSFTVACANALHCAYAVIEAGEEIPTAEEILSKIENAVSVTEETFVEVSGLKPETEYAIIAAASDEKTSVLSKAVHMTTLDENALVFNSAIAKTYSGNSIIVFSENSGTYMLALDIYYNKDERWLPAGIYTIGNSGGAEGTVDTSGGYTRFRLDKEDRDIAISDGTVTVELDDNCKYHVIADFTTAEGPHKAVFTGDIDGYSFSYDFTATSARRIYPEEAAPGEFLIKLSDADWNYELTLDLFSKNTSATQMPAGTYTVSDGSVGSASYMEILKPYYEMETFVSGTVEVRKDDKVYTIEVSLTDADGFRMNGTFTGEIDYMGELDGEIVMQSAGANIGGGLGTLPREAALRFYRDDDVLELCVIYDQKAKYMPAGTYNVRSTGEAGTIDNSNSDYAYFWYKENLYEIKSGSMNVGIVGDEYDISISLSTSGGYFKFRYKGKIDGIDFFRDLSDMTEARRMKPEGEIDGQYRIRLENGVRTQNIVIDFFADPASATLPEGTYTFSNDKKQGSVGPESSFNMSTPYVLNEALTGGSVKVTRTDDIYSLDIRLANADGYEYIGTYKGAILDMIRDDDDDPADRRVFNFTRCKKGGSASSRNSYFYLIDPDNTILDVNAYTDGSDYLPAGTYTVGDGTEAGTIKTGNFTKLTYYVDKVSQKHFITEGTMTVTVNGEEYRIVFDFTCDDDLKYRAKYKGPIPTL